MSERGAMSEVRSSELETRLLSSDDLVEVEEDIVVFVLREVRAFHAPGEVCSLDDETLSRFKGRFQFPDRVRVRLPHGKERVLRAICGKPNGKKSPIMRATRN